MKQFRFILLFLLIFAFICPVLAEAKSENWFFAPTSDKKRPSGAMDDNTLKSLGGCYLGPDEKVVYLTFDMGYVNENVLQIKDILKNENVPAAFFILGHVAKTESALLKELVNDGHIICNHTYSHKNMAEFTDESEFLEELAKLEKAYTESTGMTLAKFYRPPAGQFTKENLEFAKNGGYTTMFWSVAYADWDNSHQPDPKVALAKLNGRIHNGAVILLHPTSKTNAEILEDFIKSLKADGYRFGNIEELKVA